MVRFVYTAWFRDKALPPDDPDHEWVACFFVDAETGGDAQAWGDHLARRRASRWPDEPFLSSEVLLPEDPMFTGMTLDLPVVTYGVDVRDRFIGW